MAQDGVLAWQWCRPDRDPGLRGHRTAMRALHHAAGDLICRVRLAGEVREVGDTLVGSRREVLWSAQAGATLHRFAVRCAEASLARMETRVPVDPRLREALAVKLRWVDGAASTDELAAAWAAAREVDKDAAKVPAWTEACEAPWEAARAASWLSAWEMAWMATWAAVRDAAWQAAKTGPWGTAGEAAWEAAWNAGDAGSARDVAWDSARDAAWDAAWDAERAAQAADLERHLLALDPTPPEHSSDAAASGRDHGAHA